MGEFVAALLEAGVDPNIMVMQNYGKALMIAVREGNMGSVEFLLKAKADPMADFRGSTAIDEACNGRKFGLVALILTYCPQVDVRSLYLEPQDLKTVQSYELKFACSANNTEKVKALLEAGMQTDVDTPGGRHSMLFDVIDGAAKLLEEGKGASEANECIPKEKEKEK